MTGSIAKIGRETGGLWDFPHGNFSTNPTPLVQVNLAGPSGLVGSDLEEKRPVAAVLPQLPAGR